MKLLKYIISISCLCLLSQLSGADTVCLKDGNKVKGIVVENYHQSIVLSTIDGEKRFGKADIKDILYDRKEQNLIKLGDYYQQNRNPAKAYTYYKKAYELNPNYKEAKDKFIYMRSTLLRNPEKQFKDDMARKQALFKESGKLYNPKVKEISITEKERFKKATGLALTSDNGMPKVTSVIPRSAADESGMEDGDIIISIWGKLTGYISLDMIMDMILESPSPEIIMSIERKIIIPALDKNSRSLDEAGLSLKMQEDNGLTVESLKHGSDIAHSGLAKGDIITDIDGAPVRYMPFNAAKNKIFNSLFTGTLSLNVLRDLTLWRKEIEG